MRDTITLDDRITKLNTLCVSHIQVAPGQIYHNNKTPMVFTCEYGHEWTTTPDIAITQLRGCPYCKLERSLYTRAPNFITKASKLHDNKYDYSNVEYTNSHTKVIIICSTHGEFTQTPRNHLNGQGCPKCANEKLKIAPIDFITRSNVAHAGMYDYSLIDMSTRFNIRHKQPILCPIHGIFHQRGDDHTKGHGCPKCGKISCSTKALTWLDNIAALEHIQIQHAGNGGEHRVPGTCMSADGYCADTNTIYEFDGDAFHGNPNKYKPTDKCHPYDKDKTAAELHELTLDKHAKLVLMGYNIVSIWESDFDALHISPLHDYGNLVASKVDSTYPEQLKQIGITLTEEYKGSTQKHTVLYDECGHVGYVTPRSKLQTYKKYGHTGCNTCGAQSTNIKNKQNGNYVNRLLALNYKAHNYKNAGIKCTLECMICGNKKVVTPSAIIQRNKPCCEAI